MAEPHWTGYVGMATGIIGTLTGIAGAVLGIVSYRRSSQIKRMDSRLELKKAISQAETDLSTLITLLPHADKSRQRVAAAAGLFKSGAMEQWKAEYQKDWERLMALQETVTAFNKDFEESDLPELESKLADIHTVNLNIKQLMDKYKASVATDDADRERIAAQQERWRTS